jgi:peptidoglycan/xylan/chitin deacetylase (PgdA/CDA1 family)
MLRAAKRGTLHALTRVGLSRRVRDSAWRRNRLLILCYHGVSLSDEHDWDSSLYMSPTDFETRLQAIQRGGYAVLPLAVALEQLYAGALRERTVVITFDDGPSDFVRRAYPLLVKYGYPATVYLTTYYCDRQKPVFPVFCSYVLWKARGGALDVVDVLGATARWDLRTAAGRARALRSIIEFVNRRCLSAGEKDAFAEAVARRLGVDYDALVSNRVLHILNPDEVARLSRNGVDFQLHTHRHRTPTERPAFLREIDDNRDRIRSLTGSEPTHFCYPSGVYRLEWLPWLRQANVVSATTCVPGIASSVTNPLLLPRLVDTGHLSQSEFEGWLAGVSSFLPRRSSAPRGAA